MSKFICLQLWLKALGFNYCLHSYFKVSKLFSRFIFQDLYFWFLFRLFSRPIDSKKFKQLSGQSLWDTLEYVKCRRHGDAKPFCIFDMTDLECMSMLDVCVFFYLRYLLGGGLTHQSGQKHHKMQTKKMLKLFYRFLKWMN